jgi:hypothetical protein
VVPFVVVVVVAGCPPFFTIPAAKL